LYRLGERVADTPHEFTNCSLVGRPEQRLVAAHHRAQARARESDVAPDDPVPDVTRPEPRYPFLRFEGVQDDFDDP
jgi:hypothetical protein